MSKQVFLHIGGEKTGSSTLQSFLTRNASRLKRSGFYYPCEASNICFARMAHFPVAACLIDEKVEFVSEASQRTLPFVLRVLTRVVAATKGAVVLSCEHFSSRLIQKRQLVALRNALPADEIKVVYYIREPSELALAAWSTGIRCGGRHSFDANDVTPERRYYNHLETLKLWGSVFGEPNLIVREYSRARLENGDIRHDFCALLGLKSEDMRFDGDENQSFDAQRLEALRYINCALPAFHEGEFEWRRAENIRRLVSVHIPQSGTLKDLMSERERALIKSRFSEINQEISERYFAGQLSRDWFPDCTEGEERTDLLHRSQVDLASVLRETVIRLAEANGDYARPKRKTKLRKLVKQIRQNLFESTFRPLPSAIRRRSP